MNMGKHKEESERPPPHATGNADTEQCSPEALARETVLRFRGKLSDPETFEYLYENILAAINAALATERPPPHATGSTEPNIVAREAAEKLMCELEEAGYLDFDGGEQEERTDWLNRFTKSYLAAIERAKATQVPTGIRSLANLLVCTSTELAFTELETYEDRVNRFEQIILDAFERSHHTL